MSSPRVTILYLGRTSLGERSRVKAWRALLEDAGATVTELSLLADHSRGFRPPGPSDIVAVLRRRVVVETLAWNPRSASRHLARSELDVAVFVTARTYHPRLHGIAAIEVLDFVDRLSSAYRDRDEVVRGRARRLGFRFLSWSHRGFEQGPPIASIQRVAAGLGDAATLGALWLPIPMQNPSGVRDSEPDHDLLFFGSLGYPPNVAAVRRLARVWPVLSARRPGLSLLLAGAQPGREVRSIATAHGWDLIEEFTDVSALCSRARLAVFPLEHAAGIQIKVLEAAAAGLPQVVSTTALQGFAAGFPAVAVSDDDGLVEAVLRLMDDPAARRRLAESAKRHVHERYGIERWRPVVARILNQPGGTTLEVGDALGSGDPAVGWGRRSTASETIATGSSNIRERAVRGGLAVLGRSAAARGIAFLGLVLLARLVGPEQLGLFVIVAFAVRFLGSIGDGGLAAALIQQDHQPTSEEMSTVFTVQLAIAAALCVAAALAGTALSLAAHLGPTPIVVGVGLGISVPITALKTIPAARLERELRYGPLAVVDVLQALVFQGTAVGLACAGLGIIGFVIAALAQALTGSLAVIPFYRWWLRVGLTRACLRRLLGFGAMFQVQTVASYVKGAITPVFVGAVVGATAVGYLNWAYAIAATPLLIAYPLSDVTFALFARARSDQQQLRSMVERIVRLSAFTMLPISMLTLVTGDRLVQTLFGERWSPALPALYLFALSMWTGPLLTSSFFSLFYAVGKGRIPLAFTVAWLVADWGLGVPLVLRFGLVGIAVRTLIVTSLSTPILVWQARKVVAVRLSRQVVPPAILAVSVGGLAWILYRALPMTALGTLEGATLAMLVYAAVAMLLERDTLNALLTVLRPGLTRAAGPGSSTSAAVR